VKISDLHPNAKALLEAAFPQFAPVLIADGVTDLSETIDAALQDKGACFVLGEIVWDHANPGDTATPILATLYVNLYEQPRVAHTPAAFVLIDAAATALTQRHHFFPGRGMRLDEEKGGTVTVAEFHSQVVFNE
jgi:hypothetical protein